MRRLHVLLIIIFMVISMSGCKEKSYDGIDDEKANINNDITKADMIMEDSEDNSSSSPVDEDKNVNILTTMNEKSSLQQLSEELAIQMVQGKFEDTYNKFTSVMRQASINDYLQAWNATVESIGKYVEIYSNTEQDRDNLHIVDVTLKYEFKGLKISFVYNKDEQIDGLWFSYSLIEEEPTSTDAFAETKITFGDSKYPVTGILTLPNNVTNPPVAILVPGSGSNDLNESVGANKPFRDLAWLLAEQGIASIRYNESFLLYPELATEGDITIHTDCLNDASAAISYVLKSEKVNKTGIYVIGHSLGGSMAPKIAFDNPEVAAIVILAGSPRRLEDIIYDQNEEVLAITKGITPEQVNISKSIIEKDVNLIKNLKEGEKVTLFGCPASYWYSLNQIDNEKLALELNIPIFIAQGSADFQVYADKDYTAWQELLKNNTNVTFKLYDNLNHLFMTANGKKDVSEYNTPGKVDQTVIDDIAAWIKKN